MSGNLSFDPSDWGGDDFSGVVPFLSSSDILIECQDPSILETNTAPAEPLRESLDPRSLDVSSPGIINDVSTVLFDFRKSRSLPLHLAQPQNCAQSFASIECSSIEPGVSQQTVQMPPALRNQISENPESLESGQLELIEHAKVGETPRKKRKRANQGEVLPGRFCFAINSDAPTVQERARYSKSRRKEVEEMRDLGACFRCQLLKKQVNLSGYNDL